MGIIHLQGLRLLCQTVREEMQLQENTPFDLDLEVKVAQTVTQYPLHHRPIHMQGLRLLRPTIKEEMHLQKKKKNQHLTLTFGSRSHKIFLSTLYIMGLIYLQGLRLLHPTVGEEMHLQENTLFDL